MRRFTSQREDETIQRQIEKTQRIKETPQAIVSQTMKLLHDNANPEDGDYICDAADIFLNEKKAYMYTTLNVEIKND